MSYLQEHLSELLRSNECVIIPDFGGFVTNERPARLNATSHRISPPSREVSFNARLFHNDGLFAQHLRLTGGMPYDKAMTTILAEVAWLKRQLESGRKVVFKNVGSLYRSKEGQIVFTPSNEVNYLPAAFGLEPVFLIPALAGTEEEVATPVVAINEVRKSTQLWRNLAGAAIVPVLVASSWFLSEHLKGESTLSFLPSRSVEAATYEPRYEEEGLHFTKPDTTNFVDYHKINNPDLDVLHYSLIDDEVSPDGIKVRLHDPEPKTEMSASVSEAVKPAKSENLQLYFIVGGAFKEKSNADNYVAGLKAKGYDASIFGKSGELHLVAFGSYASRRAALPDLEQIRASENSGAWLKRR